MVLLKYGIVRNSIALIISKIYQVWFLSYSSILQNYYYSVQQLVEKLEYGISKLAGLYHWFLSNINS